MVTQIPYVTLKFPPGAALRLVAQLCPTLCDPMDCQAPPSMGFSRQEYWSGLPFPSPKPMDYTYTVHGILQARTLEKVAVPFSRGSSQPRDQTQISHTAGRFFNQLSH